MSTFDDEMDKMMEDEVGILGSAITLFKPNIDGGPNFTTGARAKTFTKVNCSANIHPKRMLDNAIGTGGKGKQWECTYDVRVADATATPTLEWRIAEGSDADEASSVAITSVDFDANGKGCVIVARRMV